MNWTLSHFSSPDPPCGFEVGCDSGVSLITPSQPQATLLSLSELVSQ
jgi:hypothetical protein